MKLLRFAPLLAFACGGNGGGGTGPCTPGLATQLTKTTGDPAPWYFNNPLPAALSVTVKDANSCAVSGIVVSWSITTGGGGLSAAQSTTNASGIATIVDSVGGSSTQVIHAASAGLPSADFQVTASAPPTTGAVDVNDNSFNPASVVIQSGGTVTWTWRGLNTHNLTFTAGPAPLPANHANATSGSTPRTITNVGSYDYVCTNHAGMSGTVTVVH
jgi:plastocyanin